MVYICFSLMNYDYLSRLIWHEYGRIGISWDEPGPLCMVEAAKTTCVTGQDMA